MRQQIKEQVQENGEAILFPLTKLRCKIFNWAFIPFPVTGVVKWIKINN